MNTGGWLKERTRLVFGIKSYDKVSFGLPLLCYKAHQVRNTRGRVRDVAPPQMCHSQSHHVTLRMTIGRIPRGEGPDRQRQREPDIEAEREGQERDTLGALSIPASCRPGGRREQLHRARQGRLGRVGH